MHGLLQQIVASVNVVMTCQHLMGKKPACSAAYQDNAIISGFRLAVCIICRRAITVRLSKWNSQFMS